MLWHLHLTPKLRSCRQTSVQPSQGTLDAAADSLASIQRAVNAFSSESLTSSSSSLLDEVAFQAQSPVEDVSPIP